MDQMATGSKAPKEPQDASPAQAPTHARPRTARRHRVTQIPTLSPAQCLHASASWQGGLDSGNEIAASAHGMGSGGSAVDAMVIGCLGVERRAERFFSYLTILRRSRCRMIRCFHIRPIPHRNFQWVSRPITLLLQKCSSHFD